MDGFLKIAIVLTALDKMSSVVNDAAGKARNKLLDLSKTKYLEGAGLMETGMAITKSMATAVSAYSKLEDAQTDLKTSMMSSTGAVDVNFSSIADLAEKLGNELPGTTADFYTLFQTMMNNGVKSQNILQGVGRTAAYLAVDLKMPYEAAGEFAARMKESTGVADSEMLKFMDTNSRLKTLGLGADEIKYAFSRSSGTLKNMGLQGLKASNEMAVLYATLIRGGQSGETAATSFNSITQNLLDAKKFAKIQEEANKLGISFKFFKDGKFMGVENMISQFGKLQGIDATKAAAVIKAITGGGQDSQALGILIQQGLSGYRKMQSELQAKASLTDKVNAKLSTLSAMWEATTGTIENMLAALGAGLAPVLRPLIDMIGKLAGGIKDFLSANPEMARFITMAVSLVGIFITLMGAVKIIQAIRIAMLALNTTMMSNPFILIAAAAILAISLIYSNWDKLTGWFSDLWDSIKAIFAPVVDFISTFIKYFTPVGWIIQFWRPLTDFFKALWNSIKSIFNLAVTTIKFIFFYFTPVGLIITAWMKLLPFFRKMWGAIKDYFRNSINDMIGPLKSILGFMMAIGKDFFKAGVNIVTSIIDGITTRIKKIPEVIGGITDTIRSYLPFSPAKRGALRDIHKVKLLEPVAANLKQATLISPLKKATGAAFNFLTGTAGNTAAPFTDSGRSGGNNITANFTINLNGGSKNDAVLVAAECKKQFGQWMKQYNHQQRRIGFI